MKPRSDKKIAKQTLALAAQFYRLMGYQTPPGFRFDQSEHPQELMVYEMAVLAQIELTETDPRDAVDALNE